MVISCGDLVASRECLVSQELYKAADTAFAQCSQVPGIGRTGFDKRRLLSVLLMPDRFTGMLSFRISCIL